jgi:uridine kinase
MLSEDDKASIARYVAREVEARSRAARIVFEMVVEAVSDASGKELRPVFQDALRQTADNIREQRHHDSHMFDLMAEEIEAYAQQIAAERQG